MSDEIKMLTFIYVANTTVHIYTVGLPAVQSSETDFGICDKTEYTE